MLLGDAHVPDPPEKVMGPFIASAFSASIQDICIGNAACCLRAQGGVPSFSNDSPIAGKSVVFVPNIYSLGAEIEGRTLPAGRPEWYFCREEFARG
jgi:hypothetical protein